MNFKSLVVFLFFFTFACQDKTTYLVERTSCLSCHRPLSEDGSSHGIEGAHPPIGGKYLSCVDCHGGNPKARKQSEAHVALKNGKRPFIKNLTSKELDAVDPKYIRFINPGDYRVAKQSCGTANCHPKIVHNTTRNQMASFSGELSVGRYRAGLQNSGQAEKGVKNVSDPNFEHGKVPGTVGRLTEMEEPRIKEGEKTIGPYQDLYFTKACLRCHLWSFGDNKFSGDFRSSGCTSCHMPYAENGQSQSSDPTRIKGSFPHPQKHSLTKKIATDACMHCHYRGGRIGPSYMGFRESAGSGLNPPNAGFLGKSIHGHDANFYIYDEDLSNAKDETPADVHFEAGMDCIDCHTEKDVHGDGHIYTSTDVSVDIKCADCHGTLEKDSSLISSKGSILSHMFKNKKGDVFLKTKVKGKVLKVPQIKNAVVHAPKDSTIFKAMGRNHEGFSHLDKVACYTCHSSWMPNCYGCHVNVDMTKVQRSLISGNSTIGKATGDRKWVEIDDLILMENSLGKIAPSMPSEKLFMTAIDGTGKKVIDKQVRRGPHGEIGHGQRTFNPHTIRRWTNFMKCSRCHMEQGEGNKVELDVTLGFGSKRFVEKDGNGKEWYLDQIQTRDFKPLVLVGHDQPKKSKPLSEATIKKMLSFRLAKSECSVPGDVAVPFHIIQETIFNKSCLNCHNHQKKKGKLDLEADVSHKNLLGNSKYKDNAALVVPGKPEKSYLLDKLLAKKEIVGDIMPPEGEKLKSCEIKMIEGWIRSGAREN